MKFNVSSHHSWEVLRQAGQSDERRKEQIRQRRIKRRLTKLMNWLYNHKN